MAESDPTPSKRAKFSITRAELVRFEPVLFALFAGVCTLLVACRFYSSIKLQTLYAFNWARPDRYELIAGARIPGSWSAPLDDVFIHFDFARETARGHAFQWSEGAGYSSGGTSLLYPFVLALGYRLGFRELELMTWAALIACVCVFGLLLAARRLGRDLPIWTSYLLPPALLCVGALDWSLFSGMEVALFLALWGAALVAWDDLSRARSATFREQALLAGFLGFWGGCVVATRPEGAAALIVLALSALWAIRPRRVTQTLALLGISGAPGLLVLVAHAVANRIFTGETTAAGALVKLEMNHPFFNAQDIWNAWLFYLKYQALRVTQYHFSDVPAIGWIAWALAVIPLCFKATRRSAIVLWASAVSYVMIVALNGQVRWQNERYTMPAVAWLLLLAGLGVGALFALAVQTRKRAPIAFSALALASVVIFVQHQLPRFREQLWFFGRASRNILDQHLQTGERIRLDPGLQAKRVLVGDAGAIPYASDVPALDVIGLGGFHGLPFARATRLNIAAGIELIERIPKDERPDLLAIYPGWWGDFPLWFGTKVAETPVRGNVICGGASKVIYRPHWEALDASGVPFSLAVGERVLDSVDPADLVSEKEHHWALSVPHIGFVFMKLLPNPTRPTEDLWDAARIVPPGVTESFHLSHLSPERPFSLVVRSAATEATDLDVLVPGETAVHLHLPPGDGWRETRVTLPGPHGTTSNVTLGVSTTERASFQLWAVETP